MVAAVEERYCTRYELVREGCMRAMRLFGASVMSLVNKQARADVMTFPLHCLQHLIVSRRTQREMSYVRKDLLALNSNHRSPGADDLFTWGMDASFEVLNAK